MRLYDLFEDPQSIGHEKETEVINILKTAPWEMSIWMAVNCGPRGGLYQCQELPVAGSLDVLDNPNNRDNIIYKINNYGSKNWNGSMWMRASFNKGGKDFEKLVSIYIPAPPKPEGFHDDDDFSLGATSTRKFIFEVIPDAGGMPDASVLDDNGYTDLQLTPSIKKFMIDLYGSIKQKIKAGIA